jgi:hypothetical protein
MYGYILKLIPSPYAEIVTALWFSGIIIAAFLCSAEQAADFRYATY